MSPREKGAAYLIITHPPRILLKRHLDIIRISQTGKILMEDLSWFKSINTYVVKPELFVFYSKYDLLYDIGNSNMYHGVSL